MPRFLAPAKINLHLAILAREASGFHCIETLFCLIDLADALDIETVDAGVRLEVTGADVGPPRDNLVHRAARAFREAAGTGMGSRIVLHKRIPVGAGLGGGSSDAATTLLALNELHGAPLSMADLLRLGTRLGSDVPFFLARTPLALAWGRGERLLCLPALPPAPVLLALPDDAVSTAEAYAAIAERRGGAVREAPQPSILDVAGLTEWASVARHARNDFTEVIAEHIALVPAVAEEMRAAGAILALLTGSGCATFAVFRSTADRDDAAARLRNRFQNLALIVTRTLPAGLPR